MATVTALVFLRSVRLGFVGWDDEILLVRDPAFRGLGGEQLQWMVGNVLLGHWVPITWLGRLGEAVSRYERVLTRYPDRVGERVSLAVALLAADRVPEAVARLEETARFSSPATLVDFFQKLTDAQPGAPVPRFGLLQAYARVGDRVWVREAQEALARLHPELASRAAGVTGSGVRL